MSAVVNGVTKSVTPSRATPRWVGYLGLGMFCIGCLMAALGLSGGNAMAACGGLFFVAIGGMNMAIAYTGAVRADLLQRIEKLESHLKDQAST